MARGEKHTCFPPDKIFFFLATILNGWENYYIYNISPLLRICPIDNSLLLLVKPRTLMVYHAY
jgi:hypothetical protein